MPTLRLNCSWRIRDFVLKSRLVLDFLCYKNQNPAELTLNMTNVRVLLLGHAGREGVPEFAEKVRQEVRLINEELAPQGDGIELVGEDFTGMRDVSKFQADVGIVLGGDGSVLRAVRQLGGNQIPLAAVNLGRLGFLADIQPEELGAILRSFVRGQYCCTKHIILRCEHYRGEELLAETLAVNELAVRSAPPYGMIELELYVDTELVTTYDCDGLIVTTPTGSTGLALSASGPILRKDLPVVGLVPLNPHTLTNRPVVDSADRTFELALSDSAAQRLTEKTEVKEHSFVVIDGQDMWELRSGERIRITRAEPMSHLICPPGHNYYGTLREKLGWGGNVWAGRKSED